MGAGRVLVPLLLLPGCARPDAEAARQERALKEVAAAGGLAGLPRRKASGPQPAAFLPGQEGGWRLIEVLDSLDPAQAWQAAVDTVSLKLDLETLDPASGYLRSGWKAGYGFQPGQPGFTAYRVRALVKFEPGFRRVRVKTEAEFDGLPGYDRRLLEDLYADLQGRIGRVVK